MGEIVRFNDKAVMDVAVGYVQITIDSTEGGKDIGETAEALGANYLRIRIEKNAATTTDVVARFITHPSTTVTASVGVPMANMDIFTFGPDEVKNLKIISADASNSQTAWCTWYNV